MEKEKSPSKAQQPQQILRRTQRELKPNSRLQDSILTTGNNSMMHLNNGPSGSSATQASGHNQLTQNEKALLTGNGAGILTNNSSGAVQTTPRSSSKTNLNSSKNQTKSNAYKSKVAQLSASKAASKQQITIEEVTSSEDSNHEIEKKTNPQLLATSALEAEIEGSSQADGDENEADYDDEDDDDGEDDDEEEDSYGEQSPQKGANGREQGVTRRRKKKVTSRKLWQQEEDDAIVKLVAAYGTKRWTFVAQKLKETYKIAGRTGKQCRERWHNHLDPYIKKDPINKEEEKKIFDLHKSLGNKWADIAKELPGRSDNCIKNYFYSTHRKHQRRINKSLKHAQVSKLLQTNKHPSADELYRLVLRKRVTYEQIRKIDPVRFHDLESTMRMLYDHGPDQNGAGTILEGQTIGGFTNDDDFDYSHLNAKEYPNAQSFASTPALKEAAPQQKKITKVVPNGSRQGNLPVVNQRQTSVNISNIKKSPMPQSKNTSKTQHNFEQSGGDLSCEGPHQFMPQDTPVFPAKNQQSINTDVGAKGKRGAGLQKKNQKNEQLLQKNEEIVDQKVLDQGNNCAKLDFKQFDVGPESNYAVQAGANSSQGSSSNVKKRNLKETNKLKQILDASERKQPYNLGQQGGSQLDYNIRGRGNSDEYNLNMTTPPVVRNPSSYIGIDHPGGHVVPQNSGIYKLPYTQPIPLQLSHIGHQNSTQSNFGGGRHQISHGYNISSKSGMQPQPSNSQGVAVGPLGKVHPGTVYPIQQGHHYHHGIIPFQNREGRGPTPRGSLSMLHPLHFPQAPPACDQKYEMAWGEREGYSRNQGHPLHNMRGVIPVTPDPKAHMNMTQHHLSVARGQGHGGHGSNTLIPSNLQQWQEMENRQYQGPIPASPMYMPGITAQSPRPTFNNNNFGQGLFHSANHNHSAMVNHPSSQQPNYNSVGGGATTSGQQSASNTQQNQGQNIGALSTGQGNGQSNYNITINYNDYSNRQVPHQLQQPQGNNSNLHTQGQANLSGNYVTGTSAVNQGKQYQSQHLRQGGAHTEPPPNSKLPHKEHAPKQEEQNLALQNTQKINNATNKVGVAQVPPLDFGKTQQNKSPKDFDGQQEKPNVVPELDPDEMRKRFAIDQQTSQRGETPRYSEQDSKIGHNTGNLANAGGLTPGINNPEMQAVQRNISVMDIDCQSEAQRKPLSFIATLNNRAQLGPKTSGEENSAVAGTMMQSLPTMKIDGGDRLPNQSQHTICPTALHQNQPTSLFPGSVLGNPFGHSSTNQTHGMLNGAQNMRSSKLVTPRAQVAQIPVTPVTATIPLTNEAGQPQMGTAARGNSGPRDQNMEMDNQSQHSRFQASHHSAFKPAKQGRGLGEFIKSSGADGSSKIMAGGSSSQDGKYLPAINLSAKLGEVHPDTKEFIVVDQESHQVADKEQHHAEGQAVRDSSSQQEFKANSNAKQ